MYPKVVNWWWQGSWEDSGRCLGQLSPPTAHGFTPEQAHKPAELAHCLKEGCPASPSETQ